MVNYTEQEINEAQKLVQQAHQNWPFKQLSQTEIDKLEWASRVLKNAEVFGVESPY